MKNTIKLSDKRNVQMVAHRGLSGIETENTAAAFTAAGNRSYYGIETDIWRTADGKYICSHDGSTGRISNTDLVIEETDFETLRSLILKDEYTKKPRVDLRYAAPAEYRDICEKYGKVCVPELKSRFTLNEIKDILDIFKGYLEHTCFISFHMENLEKIKELQPSVQCQFLTEKYTDELADTLAEKDMGLDIWYPMLNSERIKKLHSRGITVNCWTVDDPHIADALILQGIDQITTNILE